MKPVRNGTRKPPNLLCVGVEKCGTTFLNQAFAASPSILTPRKKELFFFNDHYEKGMDWYLSWYEHESKPAATYVVDVTPSYFRLGRKLERIAATLPNAKILVVLRHPVYRAFSHYVHRMTQLATRLEPYPYSFTDILEKKDRYALICTRYGESLHKLLDFFPREDILLLSYEQDIVQPSNAEGKLAAFLDLQDLDFSGMQGKIVNQSVMPAFRYAAGTHRTDAGSDVALESGSLMLTFSKGTRVWKDIDPSLAQANMSASLRWSRELDREQVQQAFEEHFEKDLDLLERDFNFDTAPWRSMDDPILYASRAPDS